MFKRYRPLRKARPDNTPCACEALESRTLMDALPMVTVTVMDPTAAEYQRDAGEFRITRTGNIETPLIIHFGIGGTASNGIDFTGLATMVQIPAGRRSTTIPVIPIDDLEVEGTETVRITLMTDGAYRLDDANPQNKSVAIGIVDNDDQPVVTVETPDGEAAEFVGTGGGGGGGTGAARFVIRRTGSTALPMRVNYLIRGSATPGVDYNALPTSVVIQAGRRKAVLTIRPINDDLYEGDETVRIILQPSSDYGLSETEPQKVSTHIVIADKPLVTLFVSDPYGSEFPPDTASFTLVRTGSVEKPLTVTYELGGTATPGVEFARLHPALTFAAGERTHTVLIRGLRAQLLSGQRTVRLTLTAGAVYNLNTSNAMFYSDFVTILDNA